MRQRLSEAVGVLVLFGTLTVLLTWPQALHLSTHVPWFDDPLLSIWRIAWIGHALTSSAPLTDANIFHPELRTLAYTDAVLLQGLVATPFLAAGASPVVVYNLLILGSMLLSAIAMYALARRLTGSQAGALVAGVVFAFVTFRFDHYMHLELQGTVFMPLALLFLDRVWEHRRWSDAAAFGVTIVLQLLSGIYYAVFLVTALAVAVPIRWLREPGAHRRRLLRQLTIVSLVAGLCALPYLAIYMQNRSSVGERSPDEVRLYSATPANYLATDPANVIHGWWSADLGRAERRLFPGVIAIGLAGLGLWGWSSRKTSVALIGLVGLVISFGLNTPVYEWLRTLAFTYRGLRAPARAAILVMLAVSLFAAWGWTAVLARWPRWRVVGTGVVLALLSLEYLNLPRGWLVLSRRPPAVATWLATQPRSVVLELPLPRADALHSIYDGLYMQASTSHWQPMLNGYSGFYPRSYLELLERTRDFPSEESIAYLTSRRVDLLVVHGHLMTPEQLGSWAAALAARRDIEEVAGFPEAGGDDLVFRLRR